MLFREILTGVPASGASAFYKGTGKNSVFYGYKFSGSGEQVVGRIFCRDVFLLPPPVDITVATFSENHRNFGRFQFFSFSFCS